MILAPRINNSRFILVAVREGVEIQELLSNPNLDPTIENNLVVKMAIDSLQQSYCKSETRKNLELLLRDLRILRKAMPTPVGQVITQKFRSETFGDDIERYLDTRPGSLEYLSFQKILEIILKSIPNEKFLEINRFSKIYL